MNKDWKDLAPDIHRQRLVIEGTLRDKFKPEDITEYCLRISKVLDMSLVTSPVLNHHEKYGWCAFTHWVESGMHVYTWDNKNPKFFSVDIYTCKEFNPEDAVNFTKEFIGENLIEVTWKE